MKTGQNASYVMTDFETLMSCEHTKNQSTRIFLTFTRTQKKDLRLAMFLYSKNTSLVYTNLTRFCNIPSIHAKLTVCMQLRQDTVWRNFCNAARRRLAQKGRQSGKHLV